MLEAVQEGQDHGIVEDAVGERGRGPPPGSRTSPRRRGATPVVRVEPLPPDVRRSCRRRPRGSGPSRGSRRRCARCRRRAPPSGRRSSRRSLRGRARRSRGRPSRPPPLGRARAAEAWQFGLWLQPEPCNSDAMEPTKPETPHAAHVSAGSTTRLTYWVSEYTSSASTPASFHPSPTAGRRRSPCAARCREFRR